MKNWNHNDISRLHDLFILFFAKLEYQTAKYVLANKVQAGDDYEQTSKISKLCWDSWHFPIYENKNDYPTCPEDSLI